MPAGGRAGGRAAVPAGGRAGGRAAVPAGGAGGRAGCRRAGGAVPAGGAGRGGRRGPAGPQTSKLRGAPPTRHEAWTKTCPLGPVAAHTSPDHVSPTANCGQKAPHRHRDRCHPHRVTQKQWPAPTTPRPPPARSGPPARAGSAGAPVGRGGPPDSRTANVQASRRTAYQTRGVDQNLPIRAGGRPHLPRPRVADRELWTKSAPPPAPHRQPTGATPTGSPRESGRRSGGQGWAARRPDRKRPSFAAHRLPDTRRGPKPAPSGRWPPTPPPTTCRRPRTVDKKRPTASAPHQRPTASDRCHPHRVTQKQRPAPTAPRPATGATDAAPRTSQPEPARLGPAAHGRQRGQTQL